MGLPKAKVASLDEFRFDETLLPWASLCLWFDGSAVPIGRPQRVSGVARNLMCKGDALIFVTTKLAALEIASTTAVWIPPLVCPWTSVDNG